MKIETTSVFGFRWWNVNKYVYTNSILQTICRYTLRSIFLPSLGEWHVLFCLNTLQFAVIMQTSHHNYYSTSIPIALESSLM